MKHFTEPDIQILMIEEADICAASNDRISWDFYNNESGWLTD